MRVAVGADHAGFPIKQRVIAAIEKLGHTVIDRGTHSIDPVDFPDITQATCAPVLDGSADRADLVCGTGAGAIMAANKIPGIRCGLANETYSAHQAVEHDDANAIALGAWLVPPAFIDEIVAALPRRRPSTTTRTPAAVSRSSMPSTNCGPLPPSLPSPPDPVPSIKGDPPMTTTIAHGPDPAYLCAGLEGPQQDGHRRRHSARASRTTTSSPTEPRRRSTSAPCSSPRTTPSWARCSRSPRSRSDS